MGYAEDIQAVLDKRGLKMASPGDPIYQGQSSVSFQNNLPDDSENEPEEGADSQAQDAILLPIDKQRIIGDPKEPAKDRSHPDREACASEADRRMTRAEAEEIVASPGKFEGERPYIPYFWEFYLNGDAEYSESDDALIFEIDDEDRKIFPELNTRTRVSMFERNDGFVIEAF